MSKEANIVRLNKLLEESNERLSLIEKEANNIGQDLKNQFQKNADILQLLEDEADFRDELMKIISIVKQQRGK